MKKWGYGHSKENFKSLNYKSEKNSKIWLAEVIGLPPLIYSILFNRSIGEKRQNEEAVERCQIL